MVQHARPQISLLMANFNHAKYIGSAIDSVIRQTSPSWELVILDDCSSDNSQEVITPYLSDPRIRLIKHKSNLGYTQSLIDLIKATTSPLIGIIDSDDALSPQAVNAILAAYARHPRVGLIYSQYHNCDQDLVPHSLGSCRAIPPSSSDLEMDCISHFKTFRRASYHQTSGYDLRLTGAEDADLCLKLEEVTLTYFIDQPLYLYRILSTSISHSPRQRDIGAHHHLLAQSYAYLRRRGTKKPSISKHTILKRLSRGISFSLARHQLVELIQLIILTLRVWL